MTQFKQEFTINSQIPLVGWLSIIKSGNRIIE